VSSEAKHEHSWSAYYVVFNALILLTVVTVALSYFDLGALITQGLGALRSFKIGSFSLAFLPKMEIGHGANIVLGLAVAIIKASLVAWYFMHQREEEPINRFVLAFCILLFLWVLTVFAFDFVWLETYDFVGLSQAAVGGQ
jgi:caa(3)-type oxidase subunit IV